MKDFFKKAHPLVFIIPIGFLLYARTLSYSYTNFDDNTLIQDNQPFISELSNLPEAFRKTVFLTGSDVFYRPIETVWFMLNAQLGGDELFVYHLSGMLLHFLAVYLIFILLMRLNFSRESSLFLSLLFSVHPVLTQAVAWVPGVVDILVTVFAISSFLFFLDFIKQNKRKYFVLHLLFFTLAMFTKEIAISLVVVCLAYLRYVLREKTTSRNRKTQNIAFLAGWTAVLVIWFLMRSAALKDQQQKEFSSLIISVFENLPALLQYIGKILFPFNLSVMPVMGDTIFLYGILAIIIFSILIFLSKEKENRLLFFGLIWFIMFLLPTFLSTSMFRVHQFYEHRLYLPLIGFLLVLGETKLPKKFSFEKKFHLPAAAVVLLFFFVIAFIHVKTFSDAKLFLDNAVRTSPSSSLAHRNMGIYYQDLADKKENAERKKDLLLTAEEEYKRALTLNPNEKDLHNNLGVIYDLFGRKELAEKEYLTETRLNPVNSQAWHNLGVIYTERDENSRAEECLKKSLTLRQTQSTLEQLALLYKKTGRKDEFEKIIAVLQNKSGHPPVSPFNEGGTGNVGSEAGLQTLYKDSSDKQSLFNLGLYYYRRGNKSEAEKFWRKTIKMDSSFVDAYNNLAICLALQGKNDEAEKILLKVINRNSDYIDGYFNLANFYAKNEKEKEAKQYVDKLKKKGIDANHFRQRGITLSKELEKIFKQD